VDGSPDPESDAVPGDEDEKGYTEISILVPKVIEDALADFLIENITGGNGLVLEDRKDDVLVRLYLPAERSTEREEKRIREFLVDSRTVEPSDIDNRLSLRHIREIDWATEYRKKFEPVEIGDIIIKSVWSDEEFPGKLVIRLEPKMAFGTGKHETTQLCIDAVSGTVKSGDSVLDLGTGSGILAILAAKLGASEVFGLDLDSGAVENARENMRLNNVDDRVVVAYGSMQSVKVGDFYDVVVSNLIRDGIYELFDDFVRVAKPGGTMILSGILTNQIDEMSRFFDRKGHCEFEITSKNEWACYTMKV
jgi:ribosomal protein L11 methyltransferase